MSKIKAIIWEYQVKFLAQYVATDSPENGNQIPKILDFFVIAVMINMPM